MLKKGLTVVCMLFIATLTWGQKSLVKEGNRLFDAKQYIAAVDTYSQLENINDNKDALYKRGASFYHLGRYNDAITDLTQAFTLGKKTGKIYFYTGASLHKLGKYADAAEFYKDYLSQIDNRLEKSRIVERIKQCGYGVDHKYLPQQSYVENIGAPVNTVKDEVNPRINPVRNSEYFFSSNRPGATGGLRNDEGFLDEKGEYKFDIFKVRLSGGKWSEVKPINDLVNTSKSEFLQAIDRNGRDFYYTQGFTVDNANIYKDVLNKTVDELPGLFDSPIMGNRGDGDLQLYNKKYIFFSSDRYGGYGGHDIYCMEWQDSLWSIPKNLGPEINTVYDEVDPQLLNDGKTLYFSSDRTKGFGGFDIFKSEYDKDTWTWSDPENVGLPLNSPGNDRYFRLSKDGQTGIFSSDRAGSLGGYDVHQVYFKAQVKGQNGYPARNLEFMKEREIDTTQMNQIVQMQEPQIESVLLEDLYYGNDENLLSEKNVKVLETLIRVLKKYTNAKVMFAGNAIPEGMPSFDLYFSVKRAEKIADYLIMKGVDSSRIFVSGNGSNYPREIMNENNISMTSKINNRRIGIYVYPNSEPFTFSKKLPFIKEPLLDARYASFSEKMKGVSYRVEFTKVNQMYKGDVLKTYPEVNLEKRIDSDVYSYTVGVTSKYKDARNLKNRLMANGYQTKVIPYLDGVPLDQLLIFINSDKYPDLKDYLLYEVQ